MRLKRLEIRNYKSLRNVVIEPTPLTVLVGPNASGKSNFADALDFLSEVYRSDLEGAVAKKGGYENICYRHAKRSSAPIRFRVKLDLDRVAMSYGPRSGRLGHLLFDHAFELRTTSRGLRSPFRISFEELSEFLLPGEELGLHLVRDEDEFRLEGPATESAEGPRGFLAEDFSALLFDFELAAPLVEGFVSRDPLVGFKSLRLFQLNPSHCRQTGVPTPNPGLDRFGANLPAVIDFLKKKHAPEYARLLETARRIMPSLESLETDFTHTKTLGLFLRESGFKRPWTSEDISDGTIQAIALLAATFDPRIKILVIEEPENSVHPWAIRTFMEAFRFASKQKQIILTTHSPILIDQIRPEELWVVRRPGAETLIDPVLSLDPSLKEAWGQGKFTLSEYLDSGALPEAVPAAGL
jgi:predicted ATPase